MAKNLVDRALGLEPTLTWELTPKGLKGTYCSPKPNTKDGKVSIVSSYIKNPKKLSDQEFVEQVHKPSAALRDYIHRHTARKPLDKD